MKRELRDLRTVACPCVEYGRADGCHRCGGSRMIEQEHVPREACDGAGTDEYGDDCRACHADGWVWRRVWKEA